MSKTKPRDMTGTARCIECRAGAVHEHGPGTPLVIHHAETCSQYRWPVIRRDKLGYTLRADGHGHYQLRHDDDLIRAIAADEPTDSLVALAHVENGHWQLRASHDDTAAICVLVDGSDIVGDYVEWAEGLAALDAATRFGWSTLCEEDPDNAGFCAYHRSYCTNTGPGDDH